MDRDYGMKALLKMDGSLEAEEKMAYISLATHFEEDFNENLKKTSLELDAAYETNNPTLWQKFLNHASIRNFIDNYLNEEIEKNAINTLSTGETKEHARALKVIEAMDKKKTRVDNSNIVVMLLPSKEDIGL